MAGQQNNAAGDNAAAGAGEGQNQSKGEGQDQQKAQGSGELNLTEEQWKQVYTSPRFKELLGFKEKAEKLESEKTEAEKHKLEEDKKYQELWEKEKTEKAALSEKVKQQSVQFAVVTEALKAGIKDTDAAVKLLDFSGVEFDDQGNPKNVADLVAKLVKDKPYLVSANPTNSGTGEAPANAAGKKIWKLSELRKNLRDHEWYKKNKDEVEAARKEGRIDNSQ